MILSYILAARYHKKLNFLFCRKQYCVLSNFYGTSILMKLSLAGSVLRGILLIFRQLFWFKTENPP
jgi:hypothetical protein